MFTRDLLNSARLAGHFARVKIMRIGRSGHQLTQRALLLTEPPLESQSAWITDLVARFDQHLQAFKALKPEPAHMYHPGDTT